MNDKPKTLPPTMRDKHRYIAFQIIAEDTLTKDDIKELIWNAVLRTLGELGTAKAKPWLVKFDEKSQTGILRCDRNYVEEIRFSLTLVSSWREKRVMIRTLGVSGTIKRLKRKFLSEFGWK
ncbi:ribonuclease P protein component 2 [Pyrococcus sp. ST04]|uniref:ribonuclease P protein component 2 n=1 Tax=Pyrococcus sp. ST04 TaxID=1183377 RepID=UPI0002605C41|nr:ribonuclease P protein component 2 [Pyrococcus sp. ST04]AFK22947.1 Ribonuclease P protein component 2 [Pyrococcus sp. ST04]